MWRIIDRKQPNELKTQKALKSTHLENGATLRRPRTNPRLITISRLGCVPGVCKDSELSTIIHRWSWSWSCLFQVKNVRAKRPVPESPVRLAVPHPNSHLILFTTIEAEANAHEINETCLCHFTITACAGTWQHSRVEGSCSMVFPWGASRGAARKKKHHDVNHRRGRPPAVKESTVLGFFCTWRTYLVPSRGFRLESHCVVRKYHID